MKSPEVYSVLRATLGPWFKVAGFKRAKGFLSWSRPSNGAHIVVWCQISQDGWDAFAGSKFVVEFQRSAGAVVGELSSRRQRLAAFLSSPEREEVRSIQNAVIAKLPSVPKNHPALGVSLEVAQWYRDKFVSITEPYPEGHDVWFRYFYPADVERWAQFILRKLPACTAEAAGWG